MYKSIHENCYSVPSHSQWQQDARGKPTQVFFCIWCENSIDDGWDGVEVLKVREWQYSVIALACWSWRQVHPGVFFFFKFWFLGTKPWDFCQSGDGIPSVDSDSLPDLCNLDLGGVRKTWAWIFAYPINIWKTLGKAFFLSLSFLTLWSLCYNSSSYRMVNNFRAGYLFYLCYQLFA